MLGNPNLLKVLRTQLETEGVGVATARSDPPQSVIIAPVTKKLQYDITIPITKPSLVHNVQKLSELDVATLEPIFDRQELAEPFPIRLKMEFATTETVIHQDEIAAEDLPDAQALIARVTNKILGRAKLPNRFAELYPKVRDYIVNRCFGRRVDLDDNAVRSNLSRPEIQEGIAKYLSRKIGVLTVERRTIEFERADFKLSETKPFTWRRNLPPLEAKKTVFNYVATYNDFERRFAEFLDKADDVLKFAALGTTEQGGAGTQFRVDYLKPSGGIGFYYPDWVVVQRTDEGEVNWIIETKGRVWEGTEEKDRAMAAWCKRVSETAGRVWTYKRVNQADFDRIRPRRLSDLIDP